LDDQHQPLDEYRRRFEHARDAIARLEERSERISNKRVATALAGIALAAASLLLPAVSTGWILLPLAIFIALVVLQARTDRERKRTGLIADWYDLGLARLCYTWHGRGVQRSDLLTDDHPYAADLDLFGSGSLFEFLCTARTRSGEQTLAAWLLTPAPLTEILERQEAIAELRPQLDLREELAILAGGLRSAVDPDRLKRWADSPIRLGSKAVGAWRIAALLLSAGLIFTFTLWAAAGANPLPFAFFALAILGFYSVWGGRIARTTMGLEEPRRELAVLADLLRRLEDHEVVSERLVILRGTFASDRFRASRSIARLDFLIGWLDAGRNMAFAPIALSLCWHFHLAFAIESWRRRFGSDVSRWLDAAGEYEALAALASYAWEHPGDPWPEIVDDGPLFEGDDIGHPLLPEDRCVANTVHLGRDVTGWVVSGSNMSGKSTLLRTVGINAVLAFCGAPVRAARLRLSPLAIGATIRIEDSLQAGRSRFYTEIRRLKELMDITQGAPPSSSCSTRSCTAPIQRIDRWDQRRS